MPFHKNEAIGSIHLPHQWEYADASARTSATGFVASDVGKLALQLDTRDLWQLIATTPTWELVSASGLSGDITVTPTTGATTVTKLTIASAAAGDVLYYNGTAWVRLAKDAGKNLTSGASAVSWAYPSDLAIASQAAGDILYFDGNNWIRLAKDAGKYLKSGASAVSWDTPASGGATRNYGISIAGGLYASTSVMVGYLPVTEDGTITDVFACVGTAPTGADIIIDVHYHATALASATTIFTTGPGTERPVIAASGFSDTSGTPDVTSVAKDGFLSFFVDQVGSTIAGSDLVIVVRMA